ncbi:type II toxin-antitoxin system RelE/ParE family toxin [Candidatus Woesearchaeota archaeon]|nr:type II toxin-antitoxin system RelE/ParE family toxin [Candidatus Woesearchaeota archaeon]
MTTITWDEEARIFLRKLPQDIAKRIFEKVDTKVRANVRHYLETLVNLDFYKIRIGDYRLFVDYSTIEDKLVIRAIRHRKDAYK